MFVPSIFNNTNKYTKKMKVLDENNPLNRIIRSKAKFGFKPTSEFYSKIQINRIRWAFLLSGKKEPTVNELKAICLFFEVDIKDYIN